MGSAKYKVRQAGACRCILLITNGEPHGSRNVHFVPPTSNFVPLSERQMGTSKNSLNWLCRAESPRNSQPDRATLSIVQGVSPGYGVVIRPEPRQLAGRQIRMSVPFMLSIDYLHINAHPYLPPTRSARGSVTIFTLPQGLRPGLLNLPPRQ